LGRLRSVGSRCLWGDKREDRVASPASDASILIDMFVHGGMADIAYANSADFFASLSAGLLNRAGYGMGLEDDLPRARLSSSRTVSSVLAATFAGLIKMTVVTAGLNAPLASDFSAPTNNK